MQTDWNICWPDQITHCKLNAVWSTATGHFMLYFCRLAGDFEVNCIKEASLVLAQLMRRTSTQLMALSPFVCRIILYCKLLCTSKSSIKFAQLVEVV